MECYGLERVLAFQVAVIATAILLLQPVAMTSTMMVERAFESSADRVTHRAGHATRGAGRASAPSTERFHRLTINSFQQRRAQGSRDFTRRSFTDGALLEADHGKNMPTGVR